MADARYRIGAVARLAGLTTHALRVWERRYGVPAPDRSDGGARLYSQAELDRVRLLKRAVDQGHAIGQLVSLRRPELERLVGTTGAMATGGGEQPEDLVEAFVAAIEAFDEARAEEALTRASLLFSARVLIFDVLTPLLVRIGQEWAQGQLCSASEHVGSALIRDHASSLLRRLPRRALGPRLLTSTPSGELHELGALLAATIAKVHGFDVLYLGPNLPASEILVAAEGARASIVALSVVSLDAAFASSELRTLAKGLGDAVDLVVGGPEAGRIARVSTRVKPFRTLGEFEQFLLGRRSLEASQD